MIIDTENLVRVGISVGDINGVGLEVILKSIQDVSILKSFTPVIYASNKVVSFHRKALNIPEINFSNIKDATQSNAKQVNVVNVWDEEVKIDLGVTNEIGGKYALKSLTAAVADLKANKIDVLVTAPINKHNIQSPDFKFAGHTGFLAEQFASTNYAMMLVNDHMKVALLTEHVPLQEVAQHITVDKIVAKLKVINASLINDFGIRKPKIAVLGLNPHSGDNGLIGKEEKEIIIPAIEKAKSENILTFGPFAADGYFGAGTFNQYDAVLAMYHDQGLIPFKLLNFESGVNFTAGLSIVRTSPDHGTAYDIAGRNIASESSFRQALYLAVDIFNTRKFNKDISQNPLKITHQKREFGMS